VAGRVSSTFSTSLSEVMAMPWDELTHWWVAAKDIDGERWALLRRLVRG
jgi:hypothetical protein